MGRGLAVGLEGCGALAADVKSEIEDFMAKSQVSRDLRRQMESHGGRLEDEEVAGIF
jgi:hypothetical protein